MSSTFQYVNGFFSEFQIKLGCQRVKHCTCYSFWCQYFAEKLFDKFVNHIKQIVAFMQYAFQCINFVMQGWTNFFLGAPFFRRAILLARPIGHAKKCALKTKAHIRSRHN